MGTAGLDPRSLEPGDRVTLLRWGVPKRVTFHSYSIEGDLQMRTGDGALLGYRIADEGVWWIRGWHERDAQTLTALQTAAALAQAGEI
jgi:hypothetical protein